MNKDTLLIGMLQRPLAHRSETGSDTASLTEQHEAPQTARRRIPHVSSMLFDLELEDKEPGDFDNKARVSPHASALLKLLQPASQAEKQLGHAVNAAFEAAELSGKAPSVDQLADSLRARGYDVRIRTALGGGATQECLRNLRHNFLTVNLEGPHGKLTECIIDPSFAEQWTNARSTPAYAAIIEALPQVYVGSAVEPLVDYLCQELAASFSCEGVTLPPWRSVEAMLSKWRPRRSIDRAMSSDQGQGPPMVPSSAFGGSLVSRAALGRRPAKSQRLSATGLCRGSSTPSPRSSPGAGSPSALSRRLSGAVAGLKSNNSRSQLNHRSGTAPSPASQPRRQAGLLRSRAASDSEDLGTDSDESSTSGATSGAPPVRHRSGFAQIPARSDSRPLQGGLAFSVSSWRAADTVPFPKAEFALPPQPVMCSSSIGRGVLSTEGFGSIQSTEVFGKQGSGAKPASHGSLKTPAWWLEDKSGGGGAVSSDASDTTQGPTSWRHTHPGALPTNGSLSFSRPRISIDSTAISRWSPPIEEDGMCTDAPPVHCLSHLKEHRQTIAQSGCGAVQQGISAAAVHPRLRARRAAHRFTPLASHDDRGTQLLAHTLHVTPVGSDEHMLPSALGPSVSATLPVARQVAAARESLLHHPVA